MTAERKAEQADQILRSALEFLQGGEPIPLHWAVENAGAFQDAWASTRASELMVKIAAHVVQQEELVPILCAIARSTLRFIVDDDRQRVAIETAEDWARGRASQGDAQSAGQALRDTVEQQTYAPWCASFDASLAAAYAAWAAAAPGDPQEIAECAAICVGAVALAEAIDRRADGSISSTPITSGFAYRLDLAAANIADTIRRGLSHRDILANLVSANRGMPL